MEGVEAWPYKAAGQAMEVIPRTLAQVGGWCCADMCVCVCPSASLPMSSSLCAGREIVTAGGYTYREAHTCALLSSHPPSTPQLASPLIKPSPTPLQSPQNCGANVIRTLTKLRAKHAEEAAAGNASCSYGINGETGAHHPAHECSADASNNHPDA